ncbi:MAG: hypothetical protein NVSMB18_12960 [Acetobacteraceae bacterium]
MEFSTSLIHAIASMRRQTVPAPCVDTYRFPPPISFGPHDPQRALAMIELVAAEAAAFDAAASAWADDHSRELMRLLYAFQALGPTHVRLPTNCPLYWEQYEAAARLYRGPSDYRLGDKPLAVYGLEYMGEPIELLCRVDHVAFTFLRRQYVVEREGVDIRPRPGDVVIDAGACLGDTALAFAAAVGEHGRVFSFDPIAAHAEIFRANMARNPRLAPRIELVQAALDDRSGKLLTFADMGAASRPSETGGVQAITVSLDDYVRERGLERVDFIKMDIEGGELGALLGAAQTIKRFRPTLAISGYHKIEDMITLPATISGIEPGYRLFLEHYTIHQEETVIFATWSEPNPPLH